MYFSRNVTCGGILVLGFAWKNVILLWLSVFNILSLHWLQMPAYTIASNAGVEGAVVVGKLLEQNDPDLGYDAATGLSSLLNK